MKSVSIFMFTLCTIFPMNVSGQWQGYVKSLTDSGNIKDASIIGLNGENWASSPPGFSLKAGEGKKLVSLFKTPALVLASGLTVAGVKYLGIKADHRSIYGKRGAEGVICVKTGQIIIGTYTENMQPGRAATQVERLADYLIENGY